MQRYFYLASLFGSNIIEFSLRTETSKDFNNPKLRVIEINEKGYRAFIRSIDIPDDFNNKECYSTIRFIFSFDKMKYNLKEEISDTLQSCNYIEDPITRGEFHTRLIKLRMAEQFVNFL